MSSFNRRLFCLAALAVIPANAFALVHGPDDAGTALQGRVALDTPVTRDACLLQRALHRRLGRAAPGRYGLSFAIDVRCEAIAAFDATVTPQFNLLGNAIYALRDFETQAVITSGKVSGSASGATVAMSVSPGDAREQLMNALADQIVTRLMAALPASGL